MFRHIVVQFKMVDSMQSIGNVAASVNVSTTWLRFRRTCIWIIVWWNAIVLRLGVSGLSVNTHTPCFASSPNACYVDRVVVPIVQWRCNFKQQYAVQAHKFHRGNCYFVQTMCPYVPQGFDCFSQLGVLVSDDFPSFHSSTSSFPCTGYGLSSLLSP